MGERAIGVLPILLTLVALQLVLALILAGILGAFYRFYRRAFLRDWSLSFVALAVYLLSSSAPGTTSGGRATGVRILVVAVSLVAAYLQVAWLLLGAWGLARTADVPAATRRLALAGAAAAGLVAAGLAFAGMSRPSPVMLRCLVAGLAYLVAAAAVLARQQPAVGLGRSFAGLALALYAADQLGYFAVGFVPHARQLTPLLMLMAFDLLATAVIGLALVAWPLEGERERQQQAAELARRRERAQACAYRVSEAARTVSDLGALFRSLHESLVEVVPARNFYIALHDAASGTVSFPYFMDERDPPPPPKPLGRGLTEYVLRTGEPLLATPELFRELVARGEVELLASDSVDWLGVPLVVRGERIGVAAIQTYDRAVRLQPEDRELFVFVCGQIAAAIKARRDEDALRESEVRLRQVIDVVPHFIFARDQLGRYLLANRALAEAYGTTVEALIGRTDADLARPASETRRSFEEDGEVRRSGRPKVVLEEEVTDALGRVRWLQTTRIPFTFSGSGRPAVLGVSIDVSERRAAEEALRRAAKEESLSVLAGGVAHDFNNLLSAILGHAALAANELPEGSSARGHVEKVARAAERAADLTRQMLAYSGRGHFVVRPTDVNALVGENLPLLEVALPKSVRLVARLDGTLPAVDVDVGQLQQVLMNLVINAAEAIGERSGTVTVATGVREVAASDASLWRASGQPLAPGRYVSLEVEDDGTGMDAATVDRIFEPFFTTRSAGRGLGLAAVLGVVRGHRGALSVDSTPGKGTVFRLLFAPSTQAVAPDVVVSEAAPLPARSRRGATVLVIDDEAVVRHIVEEVLEREGFLVLDAEDGATGVELFRANRERVEAVLLDLSMPGLTGEETFERLREIDPAVRVILSSGYDQHEAMGRFRAGGPAGFIQKPYRPQQLLAEIERCLASA
jgi:PAS domain S-box-containing protein